MTPDGAFAPITKQELLRWQRTIVSASRGGDDDLTVTLIFNEGGGSSEEADDCTFTDVEYQSYESASSKNEPKPRG